MKIERGSKSNLEADYFSEKFYVFFSLEISLNVQVQENKALFLLKKKAAFK